MSNHTTNYLFTLKTFRNDVEHQPNLVLDDSRRKYFEETARLAIEQLPHADRHDRASTQSAILPLGGCARRGRHDRHSVLLAS